MLGAITEKKPSKVAALVVNNNGGFPPIVRSAPKPVVRSNDVDSAATVAENRKFIVSSVGSAKQTLPTKASSEIPTDEASAMNATTVDSMSTEEISLALEEIRSLLSPKSIEFLQKGPVPTEEAQPSRAAQRAKQKPAPQVSLIADKPQTSTEESSWFGDQNLQGNPNHRAVPAESPFAERFDLNGRKVIDSATVSGKIVEEAVKSGLFSSRKGLAEAVGTALAELCVECLCPVAKSAQGGTGAGFFVWRTEALKSAEAQPQDELKHHQYQNEAPGYTLREILEVWIIFLISTWALKNCQLR